MSKFLKLMRKNV